jgi:hypothetical protein
MLDISQLRSAGAALLLAVLAALRWQKGPDSQARCRPRCTAARPLSAEDGSAKNKKMIEKEK